MVWDSTVKSPRHACSRRRWAVKLAGIATSLSCLSGCSGAGGRPACHPGVNAAESWIINGQQLQLIEASGSAASRYAFEQRNLLVLERPGKVSQIGQTVAYFASYQDLKLAIGRRGIPPGVHWVMYDNERWKQTPPIEQNSPERYMTLFADFAHRHGYRVILSPAQDLVFGYRGPAFHARGPAWQRYISMGLAAAAARVANVYEIQAQANELPVHRASDAYESFVRSAAAQARAANSHIKIFAGLSTKRVSSASQLSQDFLATRSLVAGYWLNIPPSGQVDPESIAVPFLQQLPAATAADGGSC